MRVEQVLFPALRAATKSDLAMKVADRVLRPFNPFTPSRYQNPYPLYENLRAAGPMSYQKILKAWNVVGYAEAEEALRSATTTVDRSSLISDLRPYSKLKPETLDLFLSTLLFRDPPDHTRLRKLVNRAFTPRSIAALEPNVEKITRSLLHNIEGQRTTDVMESFANRLPIFVISDMLGLPPAQWDRFQEVSDGLIKFVDPITSFDPAEMEATVAEFTTLVQALIVEREKTPQDDMLSRLLAAEEDGDRLSRSELVSMVAILMVAGHETTASMIGNSLLALHQNPSARDLLRSEPAIAANAVEELLRYDSPVQATDRIATADFDLAGNQVKQGQIVAVFFGAANRDPRRFDDPNELRLDRPDPRPLSFGHGIHHCLGAALARLELQVALPLFLQTFPDYQVNEATMAWKRSVTVRGPARLPVSL